VKHGSVYQRHTDHCPRDAEGNLVPHRCRGPWAYVLEYGRDSNGRRLQTSKSGYPTRAAAQSALQERVKVLATGVASHTLTVGEYLDSWLQGKHALKPSTRSHYRASIDLYLKPHLGDIRLLELQPHHLDRFYVAINVGRRGQPLSPASLRRVHACLRSALGTAVKRRLIPYNPALHIELAPENPKRPKPWTAQQCRAFLVAVADDPLEPLYHLLILTGLRRGEAVGLRWEDVDLERQFLRVVQQVTEVGGRATIGTPKSRRSTRVVPLDSQTVDKLRRHRESQVAERAAWGGSWQDSGLVFTREDGRVLRPEYVTRHFQALAKEHGLPVIRLHDLRHTNATLALEAGVDLKVVSERLGHSTTAITADIYTHVAPTVGQAAAQRIADVLAETSEGQPPGQPRKHFLADS
jgi:integrase